MILLLLRAPQAMLTFSEDWELLLSRIVQNPIERRENMSPTVGNRADEL
jgi:hypothetical protein